MGEIVDLRMHAALVSGFHKSGTPECPEVFRGKAGAWIVCNHEDHLRDPQGVLMTETTRREHLLRDVIPKVAANMAEQDMAVTEETAKRSRRQEARACECGCGERTKGGKWMPGHDAKEKGRLTRILRDENEPIERRREVLARITELGWGKLVDPSLSLD